MKALGSINVFDSIDAFSEVRQCAEALGINGVHYCLQDKDNFECRGRHDAASTCSVCIQSGTVLIQKQFKLERCFDHFLFYKRYCL